MMNKLKDPVTILTIICIGLVVIIFLNIKFSDIPMRNELKEYKIECNQNDRLFFEDLNGRLISCCENINKNILFDCINIDSRIKGDKNE